MNRPNEPSTFHATECVALALTLLLTASLYAQNKGSSAQHDSTSIGGTFVNAPQAPLRINRFTGNTLNFFDEIEVTNESSEPVSGVQFSWVFAAPPGCSKEPFAGEIAASAMQRLALAPGQTASIKVSGANTQDILASATNQSVAYLHFQVGLQKVVFSNGTTWSSPKHADEFFSPELASSSGRLNCDNDRPR